MNGKRLTAATALMLALAGCADDRQTTTTAARDAEAHRLSVQTPAQTAYEGEGKLIYRKVDTVRVASPFGVSPGEVIAAQKPMTVQEGTSPGVNIAPAGVVTTAEGGGGDWSSGGFKRTLLDKIVSFFGKLKWFAILGGAALLALYALPYTRPIAQGILRIFAAVIPFIGSAVECVVGLFKKKAAEAETATAKTQFTQVVDGGQRFKTSIEAMPSMTVEQKAAVIAAFKASQAAAQDRDTQVAVAAAKVS